MPKAGAGTNLVPPSQDPSWVGTASVGWEAAFSHQAKKAFPLILPAILSPAGTQ